MALGGGNFVAQNKTLPGAYINVVGKTLAVSDIINGIVTIPLILSWGKEGVIEVTADEFTKNSLKIFGYSEDSEELLPVREVFKHANKAYFYRLNTEAGKKASCKYGEATCKGVRGNNLKITVQKNVNNEQQYDVKLYLDAVLVDSQIVAGSSELTDNEFVIYKKDAEFTEETVSFTGGTGSKNDTVQVDAHKKYLDTMESYKFNVIGAITDSEEVKKLYAEYTKRMRDEIGVKIQCVICDYAADYEGVINLKNFKELIPWLVGAESACELKSSCTNMEYDGELDIDTSYTQAELEEMIKFGRLVFHRVGSSVRILADINSLTTIADSKTDDFKSNQTIRIVDKIANDIAAIFNDKYLGKYPNNDASRISLWNDIISHHKEMETNGAIEDFDTEDVVVEKGESKSSVVISDVITVANAMTQLYMTVIVQ